MERIRGRRTVSPKPPHPGPNSEEWIETSMEYGHSVAMSASLKMGAEGDDYER